jgi:hypothetical protein
LSIRKKADGGSFVPAGEANAPTILADEYDAWLRDNKELRGLGET